MLKLESLLPRHVSRTWLTEVGLFVAVVGVTASSAMYGPTSLPYYSAIVLGQILTMPLLMVASPNRSNVRLIAASIALLPFLLYGLQVLFLNSTNYQPEFQPSIAIAIVIWLATAASLLPLSKLRQTMGRVAIAHALFCCYGLANWSPAVDLEHEARLQVLNLSTAVWAEVGLGALVSAVLSKSKLLIFLVTVVVVLVLSATQMRGAGLAAITLLITYAYLEFRSKVPPVVVILLGLAILMISLLLYARIAAALNGLLLLDDPHRGVSSGFSGRFENWYLGLKKFSTSPIIGAGAGDPPGRALVEYQPHNGYIKMFAEYGLIFGLAFASLLFASIRKAFRYGDSSIVASLACYLVFLLSAPRYINLQIMPFLGVVAVFVSMRRCGPPQIRQISFFGKGLV